MTNEPFDGVALHAQRGASRNGSPFANDRTFRRRVSTLRMAVYGVRDLLALGAVIAVIMAGCSMAARPVDDSYATPAATLVGYGCDGHAAPIYGEFESDFPRCDSIVAL